MRGCVRSWRPLALSLCVLAGGLVFASAPAWAEVQPSVGSESVTNVSAASVTFDAQVNPGGGETTYHFEYGTSASYGTSVPIPDALAGSGESEVAVAGVHVQGLTPATVYHFRVVLTNPAGTVAGPDRTFTTQPVGVPFALPDGRQYELVSPANKYGAEVILEFSAGGVAEASEAGDRFTFVTGEPPVANPAGNGAGSQSLSTRGPSGWSSQDIDPPIAKPTGLSAGAGTQYKAFSADLSNSLLVHESFAGEAPFGGQLFLRSNVSGGYQPLARTVPLGATDLAPDELGATPDLSHIVFSSPLALTANASTESNVYEWSGGSVQLASVLPNGEATNGGNGGSVLGGGNSSNARNAISSDGSHIIWSSDTNVFLFDRDMVTGETVEVDEAQGGPDEGFYHGRYQIASSDGSRVFFTDQFALTANANTGSFPCSPGCGRPGNDLYEYNVGAGQLSKGKLTDLTPDQNPGDASGAAVQGVVGTSEDGTYVYFVAQGALAAGATSGQDNLYLLHYNGAGWTTTFIAPLSEADEPDWAGASGLYRASGRVSPGGRYLTFMSQVSLTGYDNIDASSGQSDEEVYLYDAGASRLVCVSCNPTGGRPTGESDNDNEARLRMDMNMVWALPNHWVAAVLPSWEKTEIRRTMYQPRYLSDEGRVFFDSADPLVPQDINGKEDVYEYEPDGVGSCQSQMGCIYLISSGVGSEDSTFLDASGSGGDVFFRTRDRLVSQDFDRAFDLYDAHVCTLAVPCPPVPAVLPPPCTTGDACKAAPTPQPAIFGAPASATFVGLGNPSQPLSKPPAQSAGKPKSKAKKKRVRHRKKTKKSRGRRSRAKRSGFRYGSSAGAGR